MPQGHKPTGLELDVLAAVRSKGMVGNHLWSVCCGVASVVRLQRIWSIRELHVACVIPILK